MVANKIQHYLGIILGTQLNGSSRRHHCPCDVIRKVESQPDVGLALEGIHQQTHKNLVVVRDCVDQNRLIGCMLFPAGSHFVGPGQLGAEPSHLTSKHFQFALFVFLPVATELKDVAVLVVFSSHHLEMFKFQNPRKVVLLGSGHVYFHLNLLGGGDFALCQQRLDVVLLHR